jgi:3-oxoacyl-[acyl-carrier protein] reductase
MKKVALITGGSRGIGLGIARELALAQFDLAINGMRDEAIVKPILDELRSAGCRVVYIQGNVSIEKDRQHIVNRTLDHFGKLHVLVNNAGIAPPERKDILEATESSFDQVMNTNLKGPYFLTRLVANQMIQLKKNDASGFYCIINVSSVSATVASVNRGDYCISKAGIAMSTKLWAARLGEFGIPVYEIQPGVILTDMTAGVQEKYDKLFQQGMAIQQRWGTPEDVGKVAAAMASGSMPYSTGQVIRVDGGMTIQRL